MFAIEEFFNSMKNLLTNPAVIIVLVILIMFLTFVYRTGSKQKANSVKAPIESAKSSAPAEIEIESRSVAPAQLQASLDRARAVTAQNEEMGLRTIEGKEGGGELALNFEFKGQKKWCQPGDLDTMKNAVSTNDAAEILISLEAMDSDNRSSFYTTVNALKEGVSREFKIKNIGSSFGLYICLDSKKDKSCKKKSLVDQAQMNSALAALKPGAHAQDYIFYYQPLVLHKNTLTGYRSDLFSDAFQSSVKKVLEDRFSLASGYFKATWEISKVTRSIPLMVRGNKMLVELPYNDSRCTGF